MNFRIKFSILILVMGGVLAILPSIKTDINELTPDSLHHRLQSDHLYFSVDQVAKNLVREDTSVLLIDLRSPEEYKAFNLPGSINIPYTDFLNKDWQGYLNQSKVKNIFYANGDVISTKALVYTLRMGYENNYIMKGGLNEWYNTIMESQFSGKKITAKENAIFEARIKARRLFTEMNSLPDSLKVQYVEAKRLREQELDGGCN